MTNMLQPSPSAVPSRMADTAGALDFTLVSAISPEALRGVPDLSFADAVVAPIRKYGLSAQLLIDVQLKVMNDVLL